MPERHDSNQPSQPQPQPKPEASPKPDPQPSRPDPARTEWRSRRLPIQHKER